MYVGVYIVCVYVLYIKCVYIIYKNIIYNIELEYYQSMINNINTLIIIYYL